MKSTAHNSGSRLGDAMVGLFCFLLGVGAFIAAGILHG